MLEDNVMVSADKWLDTDSEWWQLPEPIKTINFHLITKTIRLAVTIERKKRGKMKPNDYV